jgi:hypothetical protein
VAAGLVVGIFPEAKASSLEPALAGQNIDVSKVRVFSIDGDEGDSPLQFVDVVQEANEEYGDMTRNSGILPDSGGTAVPGIQGSEVPLTSFVTPETSTHYLEGYEIPDDEVDNYDDAIGDGRAVVVYTCDPSQSAAIETAFKAAGLQHVRSY